MLFTYYWPINAKETSISEGSYIVMSLNSITQEVRTADVSLFHMTILHENQH